MTVSRGERVGNYAVLIAFALFALYPILTIVVAALGPDDAAGGQVGPESWGCTRRTSPGLGGRQVRLVPAHEPARVDHRRRGQRDAVDPQRVRLGHDALPRATVLFYVFLVGIMMPTEAIVVPLYYDLRPSA